MSLSEPEHGSLARVIRYGPHRDQWIELTSPTVRRRGTAVLLHGGYWRAAFTADLMRPLVPSFIARGWAVANVEYRRGAEGWPATREDLDAALATVRPSPQSHVAIIGHSVGGQLALLGARAGDAVVALAPVTDIGRSEDEGIGENAVAEFFGESRSTHLDLYALASPAAQVPPAGDVLVVHGRDDLRVPIAHTRDYAKAVRAVGGTITVLELTRLSHLEAIDPAAAHWPDVHAWLSERMPSPAP